MANGLTKGFTQVSNKNLENITKNDFTKREYKVLLWVFRNGYGWGHKQAACALDTKKIANDTGLDVSNINETFRLLESKNVIKREEGQVLFNRHVDQWKKVETTSKNKRLKQPRNKVKTTSGKGQNNLSKSGNRLCDSDLQAPKESLKKKETPISPKNGGRTDPTSCELAVEQIVAFLNETTGKSFKPSTEGTPTLIKARLSEGFTIEDFKKVIRVKSDQWKGDEKREGWLRPLTLFSEKFEGYLQESNMTSIAQTAYGFDNNNTEMKGFGL